MFDTIDWRYVLTIILIVYAVLNILVYFLQDYLMFKPEKLAKDFQFYYENQEIEEYNIETLDGALINGLRFRTESPKGVVYT